MVQLDGMLESEVTKAMQVLYKYWYFSSRQEREGTFLLTNYYLLPG